MTDHLALAAAELRARADYRGPGASPNHLRWLLLDLATIVEHVHQVASNEDTEDAIHDRMRTAPHLHAAAASYECNVMVTFSGDPDEDGFHPEEHPIREAFAKLASIRRCISTAALVMSVAEPPTLRHAIALEHATAALTAWVERYSSGAIPDFDQ